MEFSVFLTSVADVKTFVNAASFYPYEVDVLSGRYVINGKSIMGLFSIDLSAPVRVRLSEAGKEAEAFLESLKPYIHQDS